MRNDFKEGDTLLIIKDKSTILLKKASDLDEKFKKDIEFARRTEEAWKRHERGDCKRMELDSFFEEMKKW
jgi:bifunctional DNA-binding transcriptional regulator/antitoxin component of YhaV-PrlF toxin-antitoxin module